MPSGAGAGAGGGAGLSLSLSLSLSSGFEALDEEVGAFDDFVAVDVIALVVSDDDAAASFESSLEQAVSVPTKAVAAITADTERRIDRAEKRDPLFKRCTVNISPSDRLP